MANHYYSDEDLARFPEIGKNMPDLAAKFFDWYGAVFADGAPGFILLSDRAEVSMHDPAAGESLMDHSCRVLRPAR